MDDVIAAITSGVVVVVLIALFLWAKNRRHLNSGEPIIELEKLVSCKSCGSSIPEGARKCAFCGAIQKRE